MAWVAWCVVACTWAGFAGPHVVPDVGLTDGWLVSGVVVFVLWLMGMVGTGYMLTRRRSALSLLAFVPIVWALMGFWVAFLAAAPVPGASDEDNGPAVGLVLLAVPAFAVLALLAGVGFGIAWLVNRSRTQLRNR
jgi:hypothetical protein